MIDLHEQLSEFSYGYGVTREVEELLVSIGLNATPFLPSLIHEAELGFDVAFNRPGTPLVLQFKLGQELERFRRAKGQTTVPRLNRPFWRFKVDINESQFLRLNELQTAGAEVYYVAPRFSRWMRFDHYFKTKRILTHSLMVTPNEILRGASASGATGSLHRVAYDRKRKYVCSEPVPIEEVQREKIAGAIKSRINDSPQTLGSKLARLANAVRKDGFDSVSETRRAEIFERAKSETDAFAALVAIEAWSLGAQVMFVTEPE
jgi:hypothetical protein